MLLQLRHGESSCGNERRAFALNNRLSEVLGERDERSIKSAGAAMTLHLPLGEAAPHKIVRSSESKRLQQCKNQAARDTDAESQLVSISSRN